MRKGFHDPKNTTLYVCDTYIYNSHLYPHTYPLKSEKKRLLSKIVNKFMERKGI